jgi:phosphoribosylformylglycinamidine synthase
MYRDLGFNINSVNDIRKDAFLFGESPSRVVVSIDPEKKNDFEEFMSSKKTEITLLGEVSDGQLSVDNKSFGTSIEYKGIYNSSLSDIMN